MNLFFKNNKGKESREPEQPCSEQLWVAELKEIQERWFVFLDKMEVRMEELCLAAIPELKETLATDEDNFKRTFHRVQSGIKGQMENMRKKVDDTHSEKIIDTFYALSNQFSVMDPEYSIISDFRDTCSDRYQNQFEEKYHYWDRELDKASKQDLEIEYNKIVADFEKIKDKFTCKQCGSPISIPQIFFISTYITCPHCQSQNTFEPGTQARNLQYIARELAEQRTAHLYADFEIENNLGEELYKQQHELRLSILFENDKKILEQKQVAMNELEIRRQESIKNAPILYQKYLRAMYDQWNLITPDLKEHNERMYENQINARESNL